MEPEETQTSDVLKLCRGRKVQALSDAKALGFEQEFEAGIYSRSQVNQWAGEQWLVWLEAAAQDRKASEVEENAEEQMVPVRVRSRYPR